MDNLDKKLIEDVFNKIKIEAINNFKNDLNLELFSDQIKNLFNELHELIVLICNKRQQKDNLISQFKRKKIKLDEPVNLDKLSNNKSINSEETINNLNRFINQEISNQSINNLNQLKCLNNKINLESYLDCCNVLINYLYESLNVGKWYKVQDELRILYGLITLYYIIIKLYEYELNKINDNFNDLIFKLLNKIDHGLIYSPPFLNNLLAKVATLLHDYLIIKNPIEQDYDQIYLTKYPNNEFNYQINKAKEIKRIKLIDLNDFYENYFIKKIPIIIENAIDDWPSIQKWNLNYLINKSAYRLVPVEIGNCYTESDWTQKIITIKEFIDKFIIDQDKHKGYCAQYELFERIESLSNDFYIPDYCALTQLDHLNNQKINDDVHINAWFGPKGTVSNLHKDPKNNIFSQVFGSKYIRLYSSKIPLENIYVYDSNLLNNTSQVDIDNIDFNKYPNFPKEDYEESILKKGDLLYIPEQYWHYVRSTDLSFSISFWF